MTQTKKVVLSVPALSGYEAEFETLAACRAKAAELLSGLRDIDDEVVDLLVTPDTMIEMSGYGENGEKTYCYATQADADADQDGAYAVQYSEVA